jgi:hypothetical protein
MAWLARPISLGFNSSSFFISLLDRMGRGNDALKELAAGRSAHERPFGGSLRGRIESGQLVTLAPVDPASLQVGDVVLVRWLGNYLRYLVKEINSAQFLIGNNLGKINGWVAATAVQGKVIAIERG